MEQICNECGESVAPGSGKYVNRIPDFNSERVRKSMGKPHPSGDYICAECDEGFYEKAVAEGAACPVCHELFGGDPEGLKEHLNREHPDPHQPQ